MPYHARRNNFVKPNKPSARQNKYFARRQQSQPPLPDHRAHATNKHHPYEYHQQRQQRQHQSQQHQFVSQLNAQQRPVDQTSQQQPTTTTHNKHHNHNDILWNGFIDVPLINRNFDNNNIINNIINNIADSVAAPAAAPAGVDDNQPQLSPRPPPKNATNGNPRYLARLNNDLKLLWQAPPAGNAHTESTSMPAFSENVLLSGSLFRRTTQNRAGRQQPTQQLQHQHKQPQQRQLLISGNDQSMVLFPSHTVVDVPTTENPMLFTNGGASTFNDNFPANSISSNFRSNHISPENPPETTAGRRRADVRLNVCRLESVSIRPPPAPTPYQQLCDRMQTVCRQIRVALYADGNYIDLAGLKRRALRTRQQSNHSQSNDDCDNTNDGEGGDIAAPSHVYDPCPFSPMTTMATMLMADSMTATMMIDNNETDVDNGFEYVGDQTTMQGDNEQTISDNLMADGNNGVDANSSLLF